MSPEDLARRQAAYRARSDALRALRNAEADELSPAEVDAFAEDYRARAAEFERIRGDK